MPACDCCGRMMAHGQGHQHPVEDAWVCDQCFVDLCPPRVTEATAPSRAPSEETT